MKPLTDSELAALALADATFGEEKFVPVAAEYGRAPLRGAATLAALVASANFPALKLDAAERVGMRMSVCDERPSVIRVVSEAGLRIEARSVAKEADWLFRDVEMVAADVEQAGSISLMSPDGSGILIRGAPNGFSVVDFYPPAPDIRPLAPVTAPIASWRARCGDAWLRGELEQREGLDDSWQQVVAAGLLARLMAPPPNAANLVDALLNAPGRASAAPLDRVAEEAVAYGAGAGPENGPRVWARGLAAEQADTVIDLALAVADRVGATIDDLYAAMSPAEEWWPSSLQATCLERDDLECVRLLLAERAGDDRVSRALDGLDPRGHRLIASIPRILKLPDERLYRARLVDPDAWWSALAVPEQA